MIVLITILHVVFIFGFRSCYLGNSLLAKSRLACCQVSYWSIQPWLYVLSSFLSSLGKYFQWTCGEFVMAFSLLWEVVCSSLHEDHVPVHDNTYIAITFSECWVTPELYTYMFLMVMLTWFMIHVSIMFRSLWMMYSNFPTKEKNRRTQDVV